MKKIYGKELILDIHDCEALPCNRNFLKKYFKELCDLIGMKREDLHFWDYKDAQEEYDNAPDHLKGISAIQFIKTSNITIHTLDVLRKTYINIFSCKGFDEDVVMAFSSDWFEGQIASKTMLERM